MLNESETAVSPGSTDLDLTIGGTKTDEANGQRVALLSTFVDACSTKVNHIDGLRQTNMSIALAIFAGLFGFGLSFAGTVPQTSLPWLWLQSL